MDDGDLWISTLERHVDRAQREGGGLALLRVELVDGERLAAAAAEPQRRADDRGVPYGRLAQAIRRAIRRQDLVASDRQGRAWVIAPGRRPRGRDRARRADRRRRRARRALARRAARGDDRLRRLRRGRPRRRDADRPRRGGDARRLRRRRAHRRGDPGPPASRTARAAPGPAPRALSTRRPVASAAQRVPRAGAASAAAGSGSAPTRISPSSPPSAVCAACVRSHVRPLTNGPRSITGTTIVRPL